MKFSKFAVAGIATLAVASIQPAKADVNWRQFEGTTLNMIGFSVAYVDTWFKPMAKVFEKETGIKLRLETLQAGQMRKKQDIMLAGKDDTLDLIMLQMDNRGGKLTVAGHLEPVQQYLDDPTLTPSDYNYPGDW
jgi:ABC-type glycerol-3-phosphate transport system substrate-binding protein